MPISLQWHFLLCTTIGVVAGFHCILIFLFCILFITYTLFKIRTILCELRASGKDLRVLIFKKACNTSGNLHTSRQVPEVNYAKTITWCFKHRFAHKVKIRFGWNDWRFCDIYQPHSEWLINVRILEWAVFDKNENIKIR